MIDKNGLNNNVDLFQWMGQESLHQALEGRLLLVHLLCKVTIHSELPNVNSFTKLLDSNIHLINTQYLHAHFKVSEQCCITIEISSTDNSGHSAMGTYTRQESTLNGRAIYANSDGSRFLYWAPSYDVWAVSNSIALTDEI